MNPHTFQILSSYIKAKGVFSRLVAFAFVVSLLICYCISGEFISAHKATIAFTDTLGFIVPAVGHVGSSVSTTPNSVARFALAIQWLFFPFYLVTLLLGSEPWSQKNRKALLKAKEKKIVQFCTSLVITLFGTTLFVLSDFQIINVGSVHTGSMFCQHGSGVPALFTLHRHSTFGLALVSWASPIMEVFLLLGFAYSVDSLQLVLNRQPEPFLDS